MGTLFHGLARPNLVVEVFLDLCCPFSAKMYKVLIDDVMPSLPADSGVDLLIQSVPQPWHPQSTYMHEASLAVKEVDETKFLAACRALFENQVQFFGKRGGSCSHQHLPSNQGRLGLTY